MHTADCHTLSISEEAPPFGVFLARGQRWKPPVPSSTSGSSHGNRADHCHAHSRRHSLALSAVALLHGRSLKKGRHFSQSTPYVLCLQLHTSLSNSFFTHSLACPLHLHLRREDTIKNRKALPKNVPEMDVGKGGTQGIQNHLSVCLRLATGN